MGFKKDTQKSFENVASDVNALIRMNRQTNQRIDSWGLQFSELRSSFYELRDELATNGVVRDLRKLEKAFANFEKQTLAAQENVEYKFHELEHNGVAAAINKLNDEVFKDRKSKPEGIFSSSLLRSMFGGTGEDFKPGEEATLAGKVDAIVEHLGLDVSVKPEEVEKAKVVAKRKPTTKKKGRR